MVSLEELEKACDIQIAKLNEDSDLIIHHWESSTNDSLEEQLPFILFSQLSLSTGRACCLTEVSSNRFENPVKVHPSIDDDLEKLIIQDDQIPKDPKEVALEQLPRFKEYQVELHKYRLGLISERELIKNLEKGVTASQSSLEG